jgi:adenosylmethionine-8-amino-7-oxononanoate aminotransferase
MVDSNRTRVLPLELDRRYPVLVRGRGVWVEDAGGRRYLDAMSGGSMAATLGHGRTDIIEAARAQAERLAYVHNERLTNPA